MKKFLTIILLLLPLPTLAASGLTVSTWQEKIILNKSGRTGEVLFRSKVNIGRDQLLSAFTIAFDARQKLKITKVICDGKPANYSFVNNALKINFPEAKENSTIASIYFVYEETYNKVSKFLRQEEIYIPEFAANASAKVIISFPQDLESATLNPNITKQDNSFIYSNMVPQDGVREIIKLTPAQSLWNVNLKIGVSANKSLGRFSVKLPQYFQTPTQKIVNYYIVPDIAPLDQKVNKMDNIFTFSTVKNNMMIENKAQIRTGGSNRLKVVRNPADYLQYSQEEYLMLAPILDKITRDQRYQAFPLYARIGKFVNEFIKYDENYIGKLPEIKEILRNPIGVCTEYAKLYNALLRVAKIPAVILDGGACGNENKCEGHAWNMIYYNNSWIEVDPTWDLMSGIVSSSHVYFADSGKETVEIEYVDDAKTLTSQTDFEMENLSLN